VVTQNIPLRMQLEEIQRLKSTLEEPWQQDHNQAMRAWDWDYIVARFLQYPELLDIGWDVTCREAVTGGITDLEGRAKVMRTLFDLALEALRNARARASAFVAATGHVVERLEELDAADKRLQRARDKYLFRLSLIDDAVIKEAMAEHAAGHYPSPGAALADLLAARHAEHLTPSYPELRQWAAHSPPPANWHEEEDNPV
jgi:hypothetical protein